MPRPLSTEWRARIMALLEQGVPVLEISRCLGVSRPTVYRYRRAAAAQGRAVPVPQPTGGYRQSKLARSHIMGLAQLALAHPKATLAELRALAQAPGGVLDGLQVSQSTVARALHKTGLKKRRARYRDPRTVQNGAWAGIMQNGLYLTLYHQMGAAGPCVLSAIQRTVVW